MRWINVITNIVKSKGEFSLQNISPFSMVSWLSLIPSFIFTMEECLLQIITPKKKYILYFRRTKAVISVNSSDGFSSVIENNTLFYIYDGRMFVTNNNTIKIYIFCIFDTQKPSQVLLVPTVFIWSS